MESMEVLRGLLMRSSIPLRDAIAVTLVVAASSVSATSCLNSNGQEVGTVIHNQLGRDLHISISGDVSLYEVLPAGSDPHCLPGMPETSQSIFLGLSCNANTASVGSKRDSDTLVEVTYGLPGSENTAEGAHLTFYDVDLEKGFSVPVWCTGPDPSDSRDTQVGCKTDILQGGHCPPDLIRYEGDSIVQCFNPQTMDVITQWRLLCPDSYIMAGDDWCSHGLGSFKHVLECYVGGTYPS
ncbi:hypothetical protein K431DRAFT_310695 [Polychaeton citri CBS 116435]|uniref:Uncharacterized protein n=1 Tax=Polychaeton citri CBS 116435 TaxID=1314669 RepID=A0A9P4QAF4_9PEZI|nr:hypothetical protein K431DRAFT_310695 [Polychaeton citri CBS 116435]